VQRRESPGRGERDRRRDEPSYAPYQQQQYPPPPPQHYPPPPHFPPGRGGGGRGGYQGGGGGSWGGGHGGGRGGGGGRGDDSDGDIQAADYAEYRRLKRAKRAHFTMWANTPSPRADEDDQFDPKPRKELSPPRMGEAPVVVAPAGKRDKKEKRRKEKKASKKKRKHRSSSSSSSSSSSDGEKAADVGALAAAAADGGEEEARKLREFIKAKAESAERERAAAAAAAAAAGPAEDDSALVGPMPPPQFAHATNFGGALLPGEGDAMAQFVQAGKRIPRRGEVGLNADEISHFETLGYVMSGSRHARMNAVRIRKENQVYSAEEKAALAMINYEEKAQREAKVMESLRSLVEKHAPSGPPPPGDAAGGAK
jgi:hypothetical protein